MRYLAAVILAAALSLPSPARAEYYFLNGDRTGVDQQTVFYNQGDHIIYPGGQHYVLEGSWKYLGIYSPPTVLVGDGNPVRQVPEPGSMVLLGVGMVGVAWLVRKRME